jgi:hypothetical protein
MSMAPFVGEVSGETPAVTVCAPEVRRRDVGMQKYGHGIPKFNGSITDRDGLLMKERKQFTQFQTSHGSVALPSNTEKLGFLPTADAVLFLRHEYLGSTAPTPPQRYFS